MTRDMSNAETAQFYSEENRKNFPILVRYQTGEEATVNTPQDIRFGASFVVLKTNV